MDDNDVSLRCLSELLQRVGPVEFGYRIQGLAAHVLLRLGAKVTEVNASGHPDITAEGDEGTLRFEIEADAFSGRDRQLAPADFEALRPRRNGDHGYFGVLLPGSVTRWILADHQSLIGRRRPTQIATLSALADMSLSNRWTSCMKSLLSDHREDLWIHSFEVLRRRALSGRPL